MDKEQKNELLKWIKTMGLEHNIREHNHSLDAKFIIYRRQASAINKLNNMKDEVRCIQEILTAQNELDVKNDKLLDEIFKELEKHILKNMTYLYFKYLYMLDETEEST